MSAAVAVVARLEEVSAVTALVGLRIYQGTLPQNPELPAIRVQLVDDAAPVHLRGGGVLYRTRVQVDSVASGGNPVGDSQAIDLAVRGDGSGSALIGWRGLAGGFAVTAILPITVRETFDADELKQYRVMRDIFVWWKT